MCVMATVKLSYSSHVHFRMSNSFKGKGRAMSLYVINLTKIRQKILLKNEKACTVTTFLYHTLNYQDFIFISLSVFYKFFFPIMLFYCFIKWHISLILHLFRCFNAAILCLWRLI